MSMSTNPEGAKQMTLITTTHQPKPNFMLAFYGSEATGHYSVKHGANTIATMDGPLDQQQKYGRLFSAAPELLQALKALYEVVGNLPGQMPDAGGRVWSAYQNAINAIAKAETI